MVCQITRMRESTVQRSTNSPFSHITSSSSCDRLRVVRRTKQFIGKLMHFVLRRVLSTVSIPPSTMAARKRAASATPLRRSTRTSAVKEESVSPEPESHNASSTTKAGLSNGNDKGHDTPAKKVKKEPLTPRKVKQEAEETPRKTKATKHAASRQTSKRVKKEEEEEEGTESEQHDEDDENDENDDSQKHIKAKSKKSKGKTSTTTAADLAAQKLKKLTSYVTSPYPNFTHPTPAECKKVVDLLSELHGPAIRPEGRPIDDTSRGAACGQVPSVMDALSTLR